IFSIYTDNDKTFWYDLRIFPGLEADMIQRVHLNNNEKSLTLSRVKNAWINEDTGLVFTGAEPLIRSILDSQAENFFDTAAAVDATNATDAAAATDTTESTIILELGNSGQLYLIIGKPDSSGACPARISNSELIYSISEWTVNKIFSYF
ncbi:MAG: hypothetical protein FWD78_12195, partial [Treponema sp.]|nr:hypothetical protein [Treponema sp.]